MGVRHAILGSIQVRASNSYLVLHSTPTATSFCRMASTIVKPGLVWSAVSACGVHFSRCHRWPGSLRNVGAVRVMALMAYTGSDYTAVC